jgi:hypothetical protein
MKQIVITSATDENFWYAGCIGEVFDVHNETDDEYVSAKFLPNGVTELSYILKTDARPYEETPEQRQARAEDAGCEVETEKRDERIEF